MLFRSVVAAAVSVTLPDPVPLPALTVSHESLLVAVHAASLYVALIVTAVVPPAATGVQLVGVTVNVFVPAACVTATVCPAIVTVPVRLLTEDGFAPTATVTAPLPVPLVAPTNVSHARLLAAVHETSAALDVIEMTWVPLPLPALQGTATEGGLDQAAVARVFGLVHRQDGAAHHQAHRLLVALGGEAAAVAQLELLDVPARRRPLRGQPREVGDVHLDVEVSGVRQHAAVLHHRVVRLADDEIGRAHV